MSMWKKAMDYLGLGPDDAYDDYDIAPEPERPVRAARPPRDESAQLRAGLRARASAPGAPAPVVPQP